ncbi:MAG: CpsD/CapB family tyrosine-protein kinase [Candidatus Phytoplasma sp.]|nr:CpsD/CapB family tyrosine-protein kinase [Phytoplasma sp.]
MGERKLFKKVRLEDYNYLVAKEEPLSQVTEELQKVIINLEYANVDKKYQVIQFTSTMAGEGKTTLIGNLGYLLKERRKKVIILDLDLRRPKINRVFNVPNDKGLTNYLLDQIDEKQLIRKSEEFNIDYIICGEKTSAISNILSSDKLENLINKLRENYDYILIDSPPVLAVSDALMIAKLSDGIIYSIAYNKASKKAVKEGIKNLTKTETPIIGTVLTQVNKKRKNTYYNYYE